MSREAGPHSLNLATGGLPAGTYLLTIESNGVRATRFINVVH